MPLVLESLLDTLMEQYDINSWQIYSEKNGCSIKIRMKSVHHDEKINSASGTVKPHIKTSKFKKASPSTVKRDELRSKQHHLQDQVVTRSRSKADQIEIPRSDSVSSETCKVDISPVSVKEDHNVSVSCNEDINDSLTETRSVCSLTSTSMTLTPEPCLLEHNSIKDCSTPPVPMLEESEQSDEDLCPPSADVMCNSCDCCFGPVTGQKYLEHYKCAKCGVLLCVKCFNGKEHWKHMEYIELIEHLMPE